LKGIDVQAIVFPEPGLEQIRQMNRRPTADEKFVFLQDMLDRLGQVLTATWNRFFLPEQLAQRLTGNSVLPWRQDPTVGLAYTGAQAVLRLGLAVFRFFCLVLVQVQSIDISDDALPS
jgi:hypothetical protein